MNPTIFSDYSGNKKTFEIWIFFEKQSKIRYPRSKGNKTSDKGCFYVLSLCFKSYVLGRRCKEHTNDCKFPRLVFKLGNAQSAMEFDLEILFFLQTSTKSCFLFLLANQTGIIFLRVIFFKFELLATGVFSRKFHFYRLWAAGLMIFMDKMPALSSNI